MGSTAASHRPPSIVYIPLVIVSSAHQKCYPHRPDHDKRHKLFSARECNLCRSTGSYRVWV
jgi:hypothetical protein